MAVRDKGANPFLPDQVPVLSSFADQAELALEAARARQAQQLLDMLADRERIGRDLHDHVIQRLYASGMSLQATLRLVSGHDARTRIEKVVEQLDETIRDIRTSIFELHTAGEDKSASLRRQLLDAAADTAVSPSVRMSGAIDTLVPARAPSPSSPTRTAAPASPGAYPCPDPFPSTSLPRNAPILPNSTAGFVDHARTTLLLSSGT